MATKTTAPPYDATNDRMLLAAAVAAEMFSQPQQPREGEEGGREEDSREVAIPDGIDRKDYPYNIKKASSWLKRGRIDSKGLAKYLPYTCIKLKNKMVSPDIVAKGLIDYHFSINGTGFGNFGSSSSSSTSGSSSSSSSSNGGGVGAGLRQGGGRAGPGGDVLLYAIEQFSCASIPKCWFSSDDTTTTTSQVQQEEQVVVESKNKNKNDSDNENNTTNDNKSNKQSKSSNNNGNNNNRKKKKNSNKKKLRKQLLQQQLIKPMVDMKLRTKLTSEFEFVLRNPMIEAIMPLMEDEEEDDGDDNTATSAAATTNAPASTSTPATTSNSNTTAQPSSLPTTTTTTTAISESATMELREAIQRAFRKACVLMSNRIDSLVFNNPNNPKNNNSNSTTTSTMSFLRDCPLLQTEEFNYVIDNMFVDRMKLQTFVRNAASRVAVGFHETEMLCWECGDTNTNDDTTTTSTTTTKKTTIMSCGGCQVATFCCRECHTKAWKGVGGTHTKEKCELLKQKHEAYELSCREVDILHNNNNKSNKKSEATTGTTTTAGVNDSAAAVIDGVKLSYLFSHKIAAHVHSRTFNALDGKVPGPSMKYYYENLGRIARGEWWIFPDEDEDDDNDDVNDDNDNSNENTTTTTTTTTLSYSDIRASLTTESSKDIYDSYHLVITCYLAYDHFGYVGNKLKAGSSNEEIGKAVTEFITSEPTIGRSLRAVARAVSGGDRPMSAQDYLDHIRETYSREDLKNSSEREMLKREFQSVHFSWLREEFCQKKKSDNGNDSGGGSSISSSENDRFRVEY